MKPSIFQQAVFDFIQHETGNAIVEAVAGSGKTTTIVKAAELINPSSRSIFLAFNKSIAEELKTRLPRHVEARTLNSLGYGAWLKYAGKTTIDADKVKKLVRALHDGVDRQYAMTNAAEFLERSIIIRDNFRALMELVRKAKVAGLAPQAVPGIRGLVPDTTASWLDLAAHYNIELPLDTATIIPLARTVLRRSVEQTDVIDFDDQFYMSLIYNAPFTQFDFIFVDEAQDVSDIQREILRRSLKTRGRLVAVGDPHQSIYGFRGANPESLNLIRKEFNCRILPLSICYRCDRLIIERAQEIVPGIQASPSAGEGEVVELGTMDEKFDFTVFTQTDMVVCRYTAPLIKMAYRLISKHIACKVKGRDIAQGLITLIDKLKCQSVDRLVVKLNEWLETETRRALAKDPDANLDSITDKYESLSAVIANSPFKTVDALKGEIEGMFADEAKGVLLLSTVHKAKGLEADRVFILDSDSMPSRRATKAWELQQENNLIYVALTRGRHYLGFIYTDRPAKKAA